MNVQTRIDNNVTTFILLSLPAAINQNAVILTDGARAIPLEKYTLMAKIVATGKWVPFTDETAVDGSAIPTGIYMGPQIAAADIVAGDVADNQILEAGAYFAESKLIIENAKTMDTIVATGTVNAKTVRDHLKAIALYGEDTVDISSFEN